MLLATSILHSNIAQYEKLTESGFALTPIQMGARVYIPGIGRFTQVDPVEGGVDNNYVYPTDPVGETDLTGMCPMCVIIGGVALRAGVAYAGKKLAQEAAKRAVREAAKRKAKELAMKELKKRLKRVNDNLIKKLQKEGKIDAHEAKQFTGKSKSDIYIDKKTGELYSMPKKGGNPEPLNVNIRK